MHCNSRTFDVWRFAENRSFIKCVFICVFCSLLSSSFFVSSPVNVIYRMKLGENESTISTICIMHADECLMLLIETIFLCAVHLYSSILNDGKPKTENFMNEIWFYTRFVRCTYFVCIVYRHICRSQQHTTKASLYHKNPLPNKAIANLLNEIIE